MQPQMASEAPPHRLKAGKGSLRPLPSAQSLRKRVLDSVTSPNSKCNYTKALDDLIRVLYQPTSLPGAGVGVRVLTITVSPGAEYIFNSTNYQPRSPISRSLSPSYDSGGHGTKSE
jgi:hypothetical protein